MFDKFVISKEKLFELLGITSEVEITDFKKEGDEYAFYTDDKDKENKYWDLDIFD
jgi:hypothetical protein